MATKTYLYRAEGLQAGTLVPLLALGAGPVVGASTVQSLTPISLDEIHKPDLDDAMESLGYVFDSEFVGTIVGRHDFGVLAADPTSGPAPSTGDYYYNSTLLEERTYDGASWVAFVNTGTAQALSNKRVPITTIFFGDSPFSVLAATHNTILVDASGGNVVMSLPVAAGLDGLPFFIKRIDSSSNSVTINADGSEKIDGLSSAALIQKNESIQIISDGANWFIIG